ncbi:MAG: hypothetical protein PHV30_05645 [Candidatus Margulisbacteria bacterium]|nr:hypothetical protein [Candidatus Margulisiibacteriota bacterium]
MGKKYSLEEALNFAKFHNDKVINAMNADKSKSVEYEQLESFYKNGINFI